MAVETPSSDHITTRREQSVLSIGINRPEKKNALSPAMYETISATLRDADQDPEVRVVLLHGSAEAFSSGNDLADFEKRDPNKPSPAAELLRVVHELQKPLVAAVAGLAVGIGSTILLHCDLVYAAPDVRFRLPFVNLGVCPEAGSSLLLPTFAGHRLAAEALLLGDFFDTETARELGLVSRSVPAEQLHAHALEKAQQLAQQPATATVLTKKLLKQDAHEPVAQRMQLEFKHFAELLQSEDSIAARSALLNRSSARKPA